MISVAISRAIFADRSKSRFGLPGSAEPFIRIFRTSRCGVDFATDLPTLHDGRVTPLAKECTPPRAAAILARLCDVRLPLQLTDAECDLIGDIVADAAGTPGAAARNPA